MLARSPEENLWVTIVSPKCHIPFNIRSTARDRGKMIHLPPPISYEMIAITFRVRRKVLNQKNYVQS
jgi:hypothetical protein